MVVVVNPTLKDKIDAINGIVGIAQPQKDLIISKMLDEMVKMGDHLVELTD